jgi:hypothetical protein
MHLSSVAFGPLSLCVISIVLRCKCYGNWVFMDFLQPCWLQVVNLIEWDACGSWVLRG